MAEAMAAMTAEEAAEVHDDMAAWPQSSERWWITPLEMRANKRRSFLAGVKWARENPEWYDPKVQLPDDGRYIEFEHSYYDDYGRALGHYESRNKSFISLGSYYEIESVLFWRYMTPLPSEVK